LLFCVLWPWVLHDLLGSARGHVRYGRHIPASAAMAEGALGWAVVAALAAVMGIVVEPNTLGEADGLPFATLPEDLPVCPWVHVVLTVCVLDRVGVLWPCIHERRLIEKVRGAVLHLTAVLDVLLVDARVGDGLCVGVWSVQVVTVVVVVAAAVVMGLARGA